MDIYLRQETEADLEFLCRLYGTIRERELEMTTWDTAQKEAFVRMQFLAQREHYLRYYPKASMQIIEAEGQPIGRLYVDRWTREIRIMDIALLPEFCGKGLGSQLIAAIQDEGRQTGKDVTIHVEKFNPALRLYQRLGFEIAGDKEVYYFMRWTPPAPSGNQVEK